MTTLVMLHDEDGDRILSPKQSQKMIESYWEHCHKECCGTDVDYHQKELWFCDCHYEHSDDETCCDTVEWIYEMTFMGVKL